MKNIHLHFHRIHGVACAPSLEQASALTTMFKGKPPLTEGEMLFNGMRSSPGHVIFMTSDTAEDYNSGF